MDQTRSDLGGASIGQIAIRARDIGKAVAYYRDALGLPLLFQFPQLAFVQCGGVRLMLGAAEEPEFDHPSSIIYFRVSDIASAYETLRTRGVEFRGAPHVVHRAADHDLWMAFFRDPDGNTLALMSERPKG